MHIAFKDTLPDDLLAAVFAAVIKEADIKPSTIQDICIGIKLVTLSA